MRCVTQIDQEVCRVYRGVICVAAKCWVLVKLVEHVQLRCARARFAVRKSRNQILIGIPDRIARARWQGWKVIHIGASARSVPPVECITLRRSS